jgi:queuine/archaeosine tRNA-ribosyltransferase
LNYNRGYIYHLFDVDEMNAKILIGIHNSWVYDKFFDEVRLNLENIEEYIERYLEVNCISK